MLLLMTTDDPRSISYHGIDFDLYAVHVMLFGDTTIQGWDKFGIDLQLLLLGRHQGDLEDVYILGIHLTYQMYFNRVRTWS